MALLPEEIVATAVFAVIETRLLRQRGNASSNFRVTA